MTLSFFDGGVNWEAVQQALQQAVVATSGLPATSVFWGQQTAPRPAAPAIELRISNVVEQGLSWVDDEDNPFTFSPVTIASVSGSTLTTSSPHGLLTGDGPVQLTTTGTLPSPLALATDYWIIAPSPTTLQIASTYLNTGGGQGAGNPTTPITLTSAGSGTITISVSPSGALRAGQEQMAVSRAMLDVTLELHCYTRAGTGSQMASSLLNKVKGRMRRPSIRTLLAAANVGFMYPEHVRAMLGTKDAVLFEPRALGYLHFSVPSEEGEAQTIIETAQVGGTMGGTAIPTQTFVVGDD